MSVPDTKRETLRLAHVYKPVGDTELPSSLVSVRHRGRSSSPYRAAFESISGTRLGVLSTLRAKLYYFRQSRPIGRRAFSQLTRHRLIRPFSVDTSYVRKQSENKIKACADLSTLIIINMSTTPQNMKAYVVRSRSVLWPLQAALSSNYANPCDLVTRPIPSPKGEQLLVKNEVFAAVSAF